jgi:hypothetical protein
MFSSFMEGRDRTAVRSGCGTGDRLSFPVRRNVSSHFWSHSDSSGVPVRRAVVFGKEIREVCWRISGEVQWLTDDVSLFVNVNQHVYNQESSPEETNLLESESISFLLQTSQNRDENQREMTDQDAITLKFEHCQLWGQFCPAKTFRHIRDMWYDLKANSWHGIVLHPEVSDEKTTTATLTSFDRLGFSKDKNG